MDKFEDTSNNFNSTMNAIRDEREAFWESLTKEQQLQAFCAVTERIVQGESEGRSYRGVLYGVFEFGPDAYAQAQMAGFLDLHNSFTTIEQERKLLEQFAKHIDPELSDDAIEQHIHKFFRHRYF